MWVLLGSSEWGFIHKGQSIELQSRPVHATMQARPSYIQTRNVWSVSEEMIHSDLKFRYRVLSQLHLYFRFVMDLENSKPGKHVVITISLRLMSTQLRVRTGAFLTTKPKICPHYSSISTEHRIKWCFFNEVAVLYRNYSISGYRDDIFHPPNSIHMYGACFALLWS